MGIFEKLMGNVKKEEFASPEQKQAAELGTAFAKSLSPESQKAILEALLNPQA